MKDAEQLNFRHAQTLSHQILEEPQNRAEYVEELNQLIED